MFFPGVDRRYRGEPSSEIQVFSPGLIAATAASPPQKSKLLNIDYWGRGAAAATAEHSQLAQPPLQRAQGSNIP